jgi:cytidine deaminase
MEVNKLCFEFEKYASTDELSGGDLQLMQHAVAAIKNAYAPYSQFRVGAALRLDNGKIITGNNQENVAYPSGLCAERVALFYANSNFPDAVVEAIAIAAETETFELSGPVTPCGSCRQVMSETEKRQEHKMRVLMRNGDGTVLATNSIEGLLPLMFEADGLKK